MKSNETTIEMAMEIDQLDASINKLTSITSKLGEMVKGAGWDSSGIDGAN